MISFLKKDSVWSGMAFGLIVPVVVYALLLTLYTLLDEMGIFSDIGFAEDFRVRSLMLFSICANLVLMQRFKKMYKNETVRGVLVASMLLVIVWFFFFGVKLIRF